MRKNRQPEQLGGLVSGVLDPLNRYSAGGQSVVGIVA